MNNLFIKVNPAELPEKYKQLFDPEAEIDSKVIFMPVNPSTGFTIFTSLAFFIFSVVIIAIFLSSLDFSDLINNHSISAEDMSGLYIFIPVLLFSIFQFIKGMKQIRKLKKGGKLYEEKKYRYGVFLTNDSLVYRNQKNKVWIVPKTRIVKIQEFKDTSSGRTIGPPNMARLQFRDEHNLKIEVVFEGDWKDSRGQDSQMPDVEIIKNWLKS